MRHVFRPEPFRIFKTPRIDVLSPLSLRRQLATLSSDAAPPSPPPPPTPAAMRLRLRLRLRSDGGGGRQADKQAEEERPCTPSSPRCPCHNMTQPALRISAGRSPRRSVASATNDQPHFRSDAPSTLPHGAPHDLAPSRCATLPAERPPSWCDHDQPTTLHHDRDLAPPVLSPLSKLLYWSRTW